MSEVKGEIQVMTVPRWEDILATKRIIVYVADGALQIWNGTLLGEGVAVDMKRVKESTGTEWIAEVRFEKF